MSIKKVGLSWIVVKDFKSALKFYTEIVGLKIRDLNENFGWAELSGNEDAESILGIAQQNDIDPISAGQNAVVTFTVKNLETSKKDLSKKGAKMIGDILDIPGHVKMQMVVDPDGNHFQICELSH